MSNPNQIGEINPFLQQYSDTCAIKSQQLILNDFGVNVSEDQLVQYSTDHGLYDGNGTEMQDVGKLLVDAGIPVTQMTDANVYNLVSELAQGHKVIVGVDADELWSKGILTTAKDLIVGDTPNHALIVSGIDTTDPEHVKVMLTDPGTGDYCKEYPLEQFVDAWQDSKCFMVSTQIPAPLEYNPEMIHFDYSAGHIPFIGDMSYEGFVNNYMGIPFEPTYLAASDSGLDLLHPFDTDMYTTGFEPFLQSWDTGISEDGAWNSDPDLDVDNDLDLDVSF